MYCGDVSQSYNKEMFLKKLTSRTTVLPLYHLCIFCIQIYHHDLLKVFLTASSERYYKFVLFLRTLQISFAFHDIFIFFLIIQKGLV